MEKIANKNYKELYGKEKEKLQQLTHRLSNDGTKSIVSDRKVFTENHGKIDVPSFCKTLTDEQLIEMSKEITNGDREVIIDNKRVYSKELLQLKLDQINEKIEDLSNLIDQYYDKSVETLKKFKIIRTYVIYDKINCLEKYLEELKRQKSKLLKEHYYVLPNTQEDLNVKCAEDNIASLVYNK